MAETYRYRGGDGELHEFYKATPVRFDGFEDYKFVVGKRVEDDYFWSVTELSTGFMVTERFTKAKAISKAKELLNRSKEEFKLRVAKALANPTESVRLSEKEREAIPEAPNA